MAFSPYKSCFIWWDLNQSHSNPCKIWFEHMQAECLPISVCLLWWYCKPAIGHLCAYVNFFLPNQCWPYSPKLFCCPMDYNFDTIFFKVTWLVRYTWYCHSLTCDIIQLCSVTDWYYTAVLIFIFRVLADMSWLCTYRLQIMWNALLVLISWQCIRC